ncbi:MAG: hypothetical protein IH991_17250, partial [Planctomycetes bacterium]|nr:hypothetical protein [Planctomycetota bacterium]
ISPDVKAGETLATAWDRYFAENTPELEAVRDTVRALKGEGHRLYKDGNRAGANAKFSEIIDLLHAALRHGHPQPWMYEAMAIAMQATNRPKLEIERALMSAVDFNDNMDDVMWTAVYMARLGFDERALKLFRDMSSLNPSRPEPYIQGLSAAKRLNDIDGIRWACVGVLSRAWQKDQRKIEDDALRTAYATLLQLRQEKRFKAAKQFDVDLSQAMIRDCIVRVSWTGDADIDIAVEEPTGSVCSLRNPRTTAGGVMWGDTWASPGKQPLEGYVETYVCPKAFSGKYRVYLRRIWGKTTAGKVKVEVASGIRTNNPSIKTSYIEIGSKNAVVGFDLKHGRRQELLAEHEVANIAKAQLAMNRAVLAQQLSMLENSEATRKLEADHKVAVADGRIGRGRRGGVGFRPQITTLPEGTNQTMTGIISADRRYVRITAMPVFSAVGDVTTFSTAPGGGGQGGQGGFGGGGFGGGGFGGGQGGFGQGGFGGGRGGFGQGGFGQGGFGGGRGGFGQGGFGGGRGGFGGFGGGGFGGG